MVRTPLICGLLLLENVNAFVVPAGEMRLFVLVVRRLCVRACSEVSDVGFIFLTKTEYLRDPSLYSSTRCVEHAGNGTCNTQGFVHITSTGVFSCNTQVIRAHHLHRRLVV